MNVRVDYRASLSLVGTVVRYLSVPLFAPLVVSLYYGETVAPFVVAVLLAVVVGGGLERLDPDPDLGAREGFLMVALTWLAVACVGAVPYLIEAYGVPGVAPAARPGSSLARPANALFESMSGFTTTGATVVGDISFDGHTRGVLLWRQLTQWLGGMGIVVLAVAILPELSVGGAQLMDAEAPGPGIEKLTPRIAETARVLWGAYVGFTALEITLLYGMHVVGPAVGLPGLAPNMTLYNAVAHGLTTMPTGGFSPEARSIEAFSAAVQWVIIPFMVAAGTNFALFWHALTGDPRRLWRDGEFRFYLGVMAALTAVLATLLVSGSGFVDAAPAGGTYDAEYLRTWSERVGGSLEPAVRHALFQVVSIVTTTGYASTDFNAWSQASQYALLFAMFVGGSAGSTGGAVKMVRWLVIVKAIRRELFTTGHPQAVRPVRLNGRAVDERAVRGIFAFTLLYVVLFFVGAFLLLLDGARVGGEQSVYEVMSAAASTLGNVGPGFGVVGPMGSYRSFSAAGKLLMVVLMWLGRLEILPVLVCLTPEYWRR
ncbi:TrkH family potassium uptake protein [Candidatus Halobonum tyrrellensis]|uniref:Trk-type k+ transporter, membrane component n=1 Tax=Candidatus Halobonum tyrrellensis G22 TaxID=1324957 RepID=V4HI36_9EURY|nr:TrkH family potassium uptake protein [Candidatus Halobonum tyrrellensis]ESP89423.1 trk-type k+ transporter, membrane component [Candidatus Halobonum tyrrellensis G22]